MNPTRTGAGVNAAAGPPQAIIFDLDNTLYDHRRACRETLAYIYDRYGLGAAGASLDDVVAHYFEINQVMWLKLATREIDVATLRSSRMKELFQRAGVASPPDAPSLGEDYLRRYLTVSYPLPGAEGTLAALGTLLPLGLLTNGFTDIQRTKISRLGWYRYFRWVGIAEELGVFKPDPDIFFKMCDLAGLKPASVLYVGDSPVEDIRAAREAGLRTAWVRRDGPEVARWAAEARPDFEVRDVTEILPLARSLLNCA